jgi:Cu/Ag efflux protein CusF
MKTKHVAMLAASAALCLGATAQAHHSTAMFDFSKQVEITGTVKDFEWTNPHTWTNVTVEGGKTAGVYGLEGMSPNYLSRNGWTKRTLKQGDKVTFEVHPLKDGRKGGFMVSAKLADGTVLYNLPRRPEK